MSYAVVQGNTVVEFSSRTQAVQAFLAAAARHVNAQLFAVSASGAYSNLTPRFAQVAYL